MTLDNKNLEDEPLLLAFKNIIELSTEKFMTNPDKQINTYNKK